MKRLLSSFFLTALLSTLTLPALAATFRTGETVKVSTPLNDNAYVFGGQVTVDQTVGKDLVTGGGNVLVAADVREDLLAGGGTVIVQGDVGGDIRVAGGTVMVTGSVGGDIVSMGGTVTLMNSASVRGDIVAAGGDINLGAASVGGDVLVRGSNVRLDSLVKGNLDIQAEDVTILGSVDGTSVVAAKNITLGADARLMRGVRYWSDKGEQQFAGSQEQVRGDIVYDPTLRPLAGKAMDNKEKIVGAAVLTAVIGVGGFLLLSAALVILLLVLLTQTFFLDSARFLAKKTWTSFLYGFLFFAATPVVVFLFLISIIGIPVALFIGAMYVFAIVFANPLTAIVLARTVELRRGAKWGKPMIILVSVLFYIALKIVHLIPIVGWMICAVTVCFAYGAVLATKWNKWTKVR